MLLADAGTPRNARSQSLHGFLSRDGAEPAEIRRIGRDEPGRYPSVRSATRRFPYDCASAVQGPSAL